MAHGARPNLFTFAMLGQVDVIRAICRSNPGIQSLHGPHGITLLQHARKGGEPAAGVVEYLEELGDADTGQTNLPLTEQAGRVYVGDYEPQGAPEVVFRIDWHPRRKILTFKRDERPLRFLSHAGDHMFNPGGAASVWITFDVRGDQAVALSVRDGDLEITAIRKS